MIWLNNKYVKIQGIVSDLIRILEKEKVYKLYFVHISKSHVNIIHLRLKGCVDIIHSRPKRTLITLNAPIWLRGIHTSVFPFQYEISQSRSCRDNVFFVSYRIVGLNKQINFVGQNKLLYKNQGLNMILIVMICSQSLSILSSKTFTTLKRVYIIKMSFYTHIYIMPTTFSHIKYEILHYVLTISFKN